MKSKSIAIFNIIITTTQGFHTFTGNRYNNKFLVGESSCFALKAEGDDGNNGFLEGLFGLGKQMFGGDDDDNDGDRSVIEMAPGDTNRIFEIPAKSMKQGGLKLFLSLHLMGQQNTPNPGSWKVLKTDDGTVDMIFHDETAGLSVRFMEDKIAVDRWGANTPSLQYLIQESVILNGFLDELDSVVNEGDVSEENRLFVLEEPGDAIESARKAISFS